MNALLIVGGNSALGTALAAEASPGTKLWRTTRRQQNTPEGWLHLDLAAPLDGQQPLPQGPGIAVLCAGLCSVTECESKAEDSWKINVEQMSRLAMRLHKQEWKLLFLSTSLVFSGSTAFPAPDSPPAPATAYGRQKWAMEQRILDLQETALVVRLTKIVTPGWPLLQQWEKAWGEKRPAQAFTDMYLSPVSLGHFCLAMQQLMRQNCHGIWHISATEQCSYAEYAQKAAHAKGLLSTPVRCTSASEHIDAAMRPAHVTLDSSATWTLCGIQAPSIDDSFSASTIMETINE